MKSYKWVSWIIGGIGALTLIGALENRGNYMTSLMMIGGGIYLYQYFKKKEQKNSSFANSAINLFNAKATDNEDFVFTDEMIVRLAQRKDNLLTAHELKSQSSMTLEQAQQRLKNIHVKGFAEVKVTEQGNLVYDFRGKMISDEEKRNARNILD
jgi:hypothetical protein